MNTESACWTAGLASTSSLALTHESVSSAWRFNHVVVELRTATSDAIAMRTQTVIVRPRL